MGNSFRQQPIPTLYGENKTPVTEDLLEVGLLVAFGMIAFSFILIIPGIRGWERLFATCRVFVALWVGAVILVSNFGLGWYTDTVRVHTQYKAFTNEEIEADVGLHIGLLGINITLKGEPLDPNGDLAGETINYNERFLWSDPWAAGRIGFGRYASRFNQEFRAAQFRGMPYPVLWVAEYFTLDGEQIRWGRKFRQAGWYAYQFLWLSFAVYLLDLAIFIFNVRIGTHFMMLLGTLMICAVFSYGMIIMNDPHIVVPWNQAGCHPSAAEDQWCSVVMKPSFGWSWYLVLFTGVFVLIGGVVLYFLDFFAPHYAAAIFHHNVIESDEELQEELVTTDLDEFQGLEYSGRGTGVSRNKRGLTKFRQTQKRPRSTFKLGGASLRDEMALEEITKQKEALPDEKTDLAATT